MTKTTIYVIWSLVALFGLSYAGIGGIFAFASLYAPGLGNLTRRFNCVFSILLFVILPLFQLYSVRPALAALAADGIVRVWIWLFLPLVLAFLTFGIGCTLQSRLKNYESTLIREQISLTPVLLQGRDGTHLLAFRKSPVWQHILDQLARDGYQATPANEQHHWYPYASVDAFAPHTLCTHPSVSGLEFFVVEDKYYGHYLVAATPAAKSHLAAIFAGLPAPKQNSLHDTTQSE